MRSTRVSYMYRDGSNYKQHRDAIFAGEITQAERAVIRDALDGDAHFFPAQVGLDVLYTGWPTHYEDDHPWHELTELEVVDLEPTQDETIHGFAQRFAAVTWDEEGAQAALDEWTAATPQGR